MQGLVYELVPKKGTNMINVAVLEDSIYNQYSYRSILTEDWKRDESVYLPKHTRNIIQNYAFAFIQLGQLQREIPEKGLRAFKIAHEIAPHFEPTIQLLGRYYFMAGDTQNAFRHYEDMIHKYPENMAIRIRLAELQEQVGDIDNAIRTLEEVIERSPNARQAVLSAYGVAVRANLLQRARGYLVWWLNTHPDDTEVKEILQRFDDAVEIVPRRTEG
jgi:tetratricopeptide (TPR) repeat protein